MEYSYFIVERLFVEDNGPIEGNRGNSPICFLLLRPSETQYTQMFARIIRKFPAQRLTRLMTGRPARIPHGTWLIVRLWEPRYPKQFCDSSNAIYIVLLLVRNKQS